MAIDVSKYRERKAKGLQSIRKVGGAFVFTQRRFNPETGEEMLPDTQAFDQTEIQKLRDQIAAQLVEIDAILLELDQLSPKPIDGEVQV